MSRREEEFSGKELILFCSLEYIFFPGAGQPVIISTARTRVAGNKRQQYGHLGGGAGKYILSLLRVTHMSLVPKVCERNAHGPINLIAIRRGERRTNKSTFVCGCEGV
jgi:hypothetical protein